ncbi:unnamed protein product [Cyprideis torosa]|uniref:Isochorismatase domain-containing protein 1 n=1 Tax=Cyprideis torosa TaxID=163714 RepID=A0A7R8W4D1_9CRUS|nr:unnamed protein product [Cyprideis torosa]CAG0883907.1 unnamed protein product [Cyprideis torosa]
MSSSMSSGEVNEESCIFFVCDIQERFRPAISHFNEIVETASRLLKASKILNIPVIVTEQYPEKLGSTVKELDISHVPPENVIPKQDFTMLTEEVKQRLRDMPTRNTVVLFGIESHICVEQTAVHLRQEGYSVHVVADGSSSRSPEDRLLAYERHRQYGCLVTTHETVLFWLLKSNKHPNFKEVQKLILKPNKPTGVVDPRLWTVHSLRSENNAE